jgi:hypothetical protein
MSGNFPARRSRPCLRANANGACVQSIYALALAHKLRRPSLSKKTRQLALHRLGNHVLIGGAESFEPKLIDIQLDGAVQRARLDALLMLSL